MCPFFIICAPCVRVMLSTFELSVSVHVPPRSCMVVLCAVLSLLSAPIHCVPSVMVSCALEYRSAIMSPWYVVPLPERTSMPVAPYVCHRWL